MIVAALVLREVQSAVSVQVICTEIVHILSTAVGCTLSTGAYGPAQTCSYTIYGPKESAGHI
jgi:hypothetical protein